MARSIATPLLLALFTGGAGCGSAPPAATSAPNAASASATVIAVASAAPNAKPAAHQPDPIEDAADPEKATLERLAAEPWGYRVDFWNTLHVPLIDWKTWKRVRIWGHPTRATYRYGDGHRVMDTTLYTAIEGANDPDTCLAKFMDYASTTAQAYGVHLGDSQIVRTNQIIDDVARPIVIKLVEGSISSILANDDYVGAIAAYQSHPGTCLVRGFAVVSTNYRELALKVRDRWVRDGAPGMRWEAKVKTAPKVEAR